MLGVKPSACRFRYLFNISRLPKPVDRAVYRLASRLVHHITAPHNSNTIPYKTLLKNYIVTASYNLELFSWI